MALSDIEIPHALRDHATRPFVMSFAFWETTGPALGLRNHPFTFRMPDARSLESLQRRGGVDTLGVKLETLQYSWAAQDASQRRREWLGKTDDEVMNLGARELDARIRAWTRMASRVVPPGIEADILDVARRWGARLAVMLAEELQIRCQGRDAWKAARELGELPMQKLVRENRQRIEELPTDDEDDGDDH